MLLLLDAIAKVKPYLIKALLALSLTAVIAGSTAYGVHRYPAKKEAAAQALLITNAKKAADDAQALQNQAAFIQGQRDAALHDAAIAKAKAAASTAALALAMKVPVEPVKEPDGSLDLTIPLKVVEGQRDAAIVALHDEQDSHAKDLYTLKLTQDQLTVVTADRDDLKKSLTDQTLLVSHLNDKIASEHTWRVRYRNLSIGLVLVGGGAAIGNHYSRH